MQILSLLILKFDCPDFQWWKKDHLVEQGWEREKGKQES